MREVLFEEYLKFIKKHDHVVIEDQKIEIGKPLPIRTFHPQNFKLETTTVWSFPERGKWATHYANAKYRGNWAPQVPRNLILQYTKPGDVVLDAFLGSGTTLIECKLLGRHGIGVDINYEALMVAWDRLNFEYNPFSDKASTLGPYLGLKEEITWVEPEIRLYQGDARNLDKIEDESIDLIATHPPYANIIGYTKKARSSVEGDLSKVRSIDEFIQEMKKVAEEFYRVLKPGKYAAILMGDTRRHRHYVPIAFRVMKAFLEAGFIVKEDIIKVQHHMRGTEPWKTRKRDFYLIAHEHLFVFRKPSSEENVKRFKESMKV
ncbi:DNA methyltransferase [Palaeococcus ferrophilus]|uniref:DNA methyltransferase n=1 Tax=Palaeococcus ferrophilus TaxID=83868 RepID=UPI00064F6FB2|nr:DNA methyltransferase [Palaeococcus ferrophilus]